MNVDKFGHNVHKRLRVSEAFNNINNALIKSEKGEYDLKSHRLRGLTFPESADEATNKMYVDELLESSLKSIKNHVQLILTQIQDKYYTRSEVDHLLNQKAK